MDTINVSLITKDRDGFETRIAGFDVPHYPSYKSGEYLFYQKFVKGKHDGGQKLTQYKIEDVHHSVRQYEKLASNDARFPTTSTNLSVEVYLREIP